MILDITPEFQPFDPCPEGYRERQEWARVQLKAGLRQRKCCDCSLWKFPQEMADETIKSQAQTRAGEVIRFESPICKACWEQRQQKKIK